MAKLDLTEFPELRNMMSRRERERNYIKSQRNLDRHKGEEILEFWMELAERIDQEDSLENMELTLREIRGDIDMLKAVRQSLEISKDEPDHQAQISQLIRLIMLLLDICEKFKRKHWALRDQALAYFMAVNPAMPSKAKDKYESKKDKKKAGQAKAKEAVDQSKAPAAKKGPAQNKRSKPEKKMEA